MAARSLLSEMKPSCILLPDPALARPGLPRLKAKGLSRQTRYLNPCVCSMHRKPNCCKYVEREVQIAAKSQSGVMKTATSQSYISPRGQFRSPEHRCLAAGGRLFALIFHKSTMPIKSGSSAQELFQLAQWLPRRPTLSLSRRLAASCAFSLPSCTGAGGCPLSSSEQ